MDDLKLLVREHDPHIIALSETWLDCTKNINITGFNIAREDRADGYGGVLIACRHDISATRININSTYECVGCLIQLPNRTISVGSLYLPNSSTRSRLDLVEFKSLVLQFPAPRFLLGDFNSHNQQWGSSFNDRRSQILLTTFDDMDMTTLNTGEMTRIACPPTPCSSIDLSVCTASVALNCHWRILNHTHGSDHLPILVSFNTPLLVQSPISSDLCKKIDWIMYTDLVQKALVKKLMFHKTHNKNMRL